MKIVQLLILAVSMLFTTGCPRPFTPTFCEAADKITVDNSCYEASEGLIVQASGLVTADSTIRLEWTVYIFADSSGHEYFDHADITVNDGFRWIVVPDSLLKDNQKIYVRVDTHCPGNEKAPGLCYNQFVKRYKKSSACYKWEAQPF
ncbi:hypothetical protein [Spirosoma pollinicola]|uniref:hypothetical protein n=1 Tax=Spirosoma pollinicola TaxID=2057025 RepID=UPI00197D3FCC|nr:hypothetical protein [Spirosoma pollinicola]